MTVEAYGRGARDVRATDNHVSPSARLPPPQQPFGHG